MNKLVFDMKDRRPVWALPDWAVERIRDALPTDWTMTAVSAPADGSGDGSARANDEVLAAVEDARIYMGFGIPAEVLTTGTLLEWVHSGAAGVGSSLTPEMLASPVRFTNSAGIHGSPMAETVLGMILYFARGFDFAVEGKARSRWATDPYYDDDSPIRELGDSVVGIVGLGGVGGEVARRALAMGARVIGLRRDASGSVRSDWAGGVPDERLRVVTGEAGLYELLGESHYVVLSAPSTPATRGMLSRGALAGMRADAVLVNISRGDLVDEEALVDALREGRLRGAGLDVFGVEPLPKDHPYWDLANVMLTPHVSAVTRSFWRREVELILLNLRRFLDDEPLMNQVDKIEAY